MKKYILAIGLVAFLMTSCCDKKENKEAKDCCKGKQEQCDKHHECDHHQAPCPEMMEHIDMMINALATMPRDDGTHRHDDQRFGQLERPRRGTARRPHRNGKETR